MIIGLTGGIASGKSVVAKEFEALGISTIDCDQIARELTKKGERGAIEILREFGASYFTYGELDRKKLSQLVFSNSDELKRLNSIMHPMILSRVGEMIELFRENNRALVVQVPLLFELKLEAMFDLIIAVDAPIEMRIERVCERDDVDRALARAIIDKQISSNERNRLADIVLNNDGSLDELKEKVKEIYKKNLGNK